MACVAKSGEESVSAVLSEVTRFAALVALLLWIRIRGEGHIVRRASAVLRVGASPLARVSQPAERNGAPGEIRTHDLCLRRATLYPAELRVLGMPAGAAPYSTLFCASSVRSRRNLKSIKQLQVPRRCSSGRSIPGQGLCRAAINPCFP